ncbi:hypothetical protein [Aeromicrobium sp. Sec7.5]|uniref:hypothetical protein n=1 Tax=Aeromicrobium sp. Sec7.5 TaxID=3121276 RepID=UPI002FE46B0E
MSSESLSAPEYARELAALNRVRRRVAALGFLTVVGHGVVALPLVAHHVEGQGRTSDAVILLIVTVFVTTVAIAVTRLILGRRPMTPLWALVPVAVPLIAAWWIWG